MNESVYWLECKSEANEFIFVWFTLIFARKDTYE